MASSTERLWVLTWEAVALLNSDRDQQASVNWPVNLEARRKIEPLRRRRANRARCVDSGWLGQTPERLG
jgi:hypothetical protein